MKLQKLAALLVIICLIFGLSACRDMKKDGENTNQSTAPSSTQSTSGKTSATLPDISDSGKTESGDITGKDDIFGEGGLELPEDPLETDIPEPEPVEPTVVVESSQPNTVTDATTGELELPPDEFDQP